MRTPRRPPIPREIRLVARAMLEAGKIPECVAAALHVPVADIHQVQAWLGHIRARSNVQAHRDTASKFVEQLQNPAPVGTAQRASNEFRASRREKIAQAAKKVRAASAGSKKLNCVIVKNLSGACAPCGSSVPEAMHVTAESPDAPAMLRCQNCCPVCGQNKL